MRGITAPDRRYTAESNNKNNMEVVQRQACRWREQVKDPNLSTWNFSHLIFDKDTKNKLEEKKAFSTNAAGNTECPVAEE